MEEENDLKFHHAKFEADKSKVFKLLFLLRSSKNSESPRYSLVESVFCCWGSTGSTGDGFPFIIGEAKIPAGTKHSFKSKYSMRYEN